MNQMRNWVCLLLVTMLTFCGCTATQPTPDATPTVIPFPTFTATPAAMPNATETVIAAPSTTDQAATTPLPAVLYVINAAGQISRLSADGKSMTTLTNESERIEAFDISPVDGRIAYSFDDHLIEVTPTGAYIDKVRGPDHGVHSPLFAPDGNTIYFYQNGAGLQRIPIGVDQIAETVLAESVVVTNVSIGATLPVNRYPHSWSPDGRYLVLWSCVLECGYYELFDLQTQRLIPLTLNDLADQMEVAPMGQWSWHPQAATPLMTTKGLIGPRSAVMRANPATGYVDVLFKTLTIGETTYEQPHMISAWSVNEETLLLVGTSAIGKEAYLYQADQHGVVLSATALGLPFLQVRELIWATDGSGFVYSTPDELRWLPLNGEPSVKLPIFGTALRWAPQ